MNRKKVQKVSKIKKETFKVGDKVILITARWGDGKTNPYFGGSQGKIVGTISNFTPRSEFAFTVKWDNGSVNSYKTGDLTKFKKGMKIVLYSTILKKKYRKAVAFGIKFLNKEVGPKWYKKVNLKTLRLSSGSMCVAGQVFADYMESRTGYDVLDEKYSFSREQKNDHGFNVSIEESAVGGFDLLQAEWVKRISKLKDSDKVVRALARKVKPTKITKKVSKVSKKK